MKAGVLIPEEVKEECCIRTEVGNTLLLREAGIYCICSHPGAGNASGVFFVCNTL